MLVSEIVFFCHFGYFKVSLNLKNQQQQKQIQQDSNFSFNPLLESPEKEIM